MCEAWKQEVQGFGLEFNEREAQWEIDKHVDIMETATMIISFCPFCGSRLDGDGCTGDWRVNKWSREEDK